MENKFVDFFFFSFSYTCSKVVNLGAIGYHVWNNTFLWSKNYSVKNIQVHKLRLWTKNCVGPIRKKKGEI